MDMTLTLAVAPQTTTHEAVVCMQSAVDLLNQLNQRDIRYCHWKSNLRLERGLSGKTDLDLLVDRQHEGVFKKILAEHAVKPFLAPPGKRYPAIEDYLGFDPGSGRLFHLHVHYELVLGEQFVKNYRLPLEAAFLDQTRLYHGVKIPAPELELIVLCMRALLKYRDRDVIKDILSIRSPGLKSEMMDEITWLFGQTTLDKVARTLSTTAAGVVPGDLVLEFLKTVVATPRAGYRLFRLRSGVRQSLRSYQRQNGFRASIEYFQQAWRRRKSFWKFAPDRRMSLTDNGKIFALVGADGAGKSTLCQEFSRWLGWRIEVQNYYLGSKQPSWTSDLLYKLFRVFRRGHRELCSLIGENNVVSGLFESIRQTMLYGHYLSTGYDRYRRIQAGHEDAHKGSIVVFDRFPLRAPLDGPEIQQLVNGHTGRIGRAFASAEQNLYRKFRLPDYLILLDVSPDVSMERKPDHKRAAIEEKSRVLNDLAAEFEAHPNGVNLIHLNADQPLDQVLSQMKQEIWEAL
jgi:adenylate kinase family enzyme